MAVYLVQHIVITASSHHTGTVAPHLSSPHSSLY